MSASARPMRTSAKRMLRRLRSTVRARFGSNRSETNSPNRCAPRRSARNFRQLLTHRRVEMNGVVLINYIAEHVGKRLPVLRVEDRRGSDAIDPSPDGIEADLQRLDCLRRGVRWNFARVIFAVGQEHN